MNIPDTDTFNSIQSDLITRLLVFVGVIVIFTLIIDVLKLDNHFYGLNSETTTMETVYFVCLSFSGMGYGGIYAQTSVARLIMVILSVIKFILIIDTFALVSRDSTVQENIDKQVKERIEDLNLNTLIDKMKDKSALYENLQGSDSIIHLNDKLNEFMNLFGDKDAFTNFKNLSNANDKVNAASFFGIKEANKNILTEISKRFKGFDLEGFKKNLEQIKDKINPNK